MQRSDRLCPGQGESVRFEAFAWEIGHTATSAIKWTDWLEHCIRQVHVPARVRTVQPSPERGFIPKNPSVLADDWITSSGRYVQILCLHTMGTMHIYLG
jgi:hypothetical protein